jgi:hypothetical protein
MAAEGMSLTCMCGEKETPLRNGTGFLSVHLVISYFFFAFALAFDLAFAFGFDDSSPNGF